MAAIYWNGVSDAHKNAFAEATKLVAELERHYPHQPNQVQGELSRRLGNIEARPENLHKMRTLELATAYQHISDGNGGVDREAHRTAFDRMNAALRGQNHISGLLRSEQIAAKANMGVTPSEHHIKTGIVTPAPSERNIKNGGLATRIAGGVAVSLAAGTAAAAEPNATPTSVFNHMVKAAIDSQIPGLTSLVNGQACQAIGEVAGTITSTAVAAAGVGLGTTATVYTGGLAGVLIGAGLAKVTMDASISTYNVTEETAKNGCHVVTEAIRKHTHKLGL